MILGKSYKTFELIIELTFIRYVYVPTACQQLQQCRVHISFHGCSMTIADIGTDFVENTGLNEIAEA
jgi:hypothetical protein